MPIRRSILGICFLLFSYTEAFCVGGYIGDNPGFDFYSKIDDSTSIVEEKMISNILRETPTLDKLGKKCKNSKILTGKTTNETLLKELQGQYYGGLSNLLKNEPGVTTETFSELARCLSDAYTEVGYRARASLDRTERVSQAGLYSDGDKNNSEYDIIVDLQKINSIIFSEKIPYTGTKNTVSKSLSSLLAGKSPNPLIAPPVNGTGGRSEGDVFIIDPTVPPGTNPNLTELLGTTCSDPKAVSGPVDSLLDTDFATELADIISGQSPNSLGYSATDDRSNLDGSGTRAPLTSASDYSDTMPCPSGQIFCIDMKMIPGGNITLGGGKNVSIEGILDTYSKHLYPISESDLSYKRMTNQNFQSTEKSGKFTIAGLRVYIAEKGQRSRIDKEETTPGRTADKLQNIIDCAALSSGLPTNAKEANTLASAGLRMTTSTTVNQLDQITPLRPQEGRNAALQVNCYTNYMDDGRRKYANSLSTDLTDFQSFTDGLLREIEEYISILAAMDKKPKAP